MKYLVYDNDQIKKEILYCGIDDDTTESIIKALVTHYYIKKFNSKDHTCINRGRIKNDSDVFIMRSVEDGNLYIYQVCEKVSDCTGFIVPHTHYIRKIGVCTEQ